MTELIEKLYMLSLYMLAFFKYIAESNEIWLPCIQIGISFLAAVMYWLNGDTRKSIYWLAAGILTISITF